MNINIPATLLILNSFQIGSSENNKKEDFQRMILLIYLICL